MIIKTVLFFVILTWSQGVKCADMLDDYINFDENTFESYNVKCFQTFFTYISILFDVKMFNTSFVFPGEKETIRIHYIRLLRIYYAVENSKMNILFSKIWNFYYHILTWIESNEDVLVKKAEEIILVGKDNNLWDIHIPINEEVVRNSYRACEKTLILIIPPSIFIENKYDEMYSLNINKTEIIYEYIPTILKFGYNILLAITTQDEIEALFKLNESHQKIFIIDLMNEMVINIFVAVLQVLNELDSIESTKDVKLTLLKSMHTKIIDTTESLFRIQEDRTGYSGLKIIKKDDSLPNAVNNIISGELRSKHLNDVLDKLRSRRIKKSKIEFTTSGIGSSSGATQQHKFSEFDEAYLIYTNKIKVQLGLPNEEHINKEFKNHYPGRLTTLTLNNNKTCVVNVSVFRYYPINPDNISTIQNLTSSDSKFTCILELNIWTTIIRAFANMMNSDDTLNRQVKTYNEWMINRFRNDKALIASIETGPQNSVTY